MTDLDTSFGEGTDRRVQPEGEAEPRIPARDGLRLALVRGYVGVYGQIKDRLGLDLPGLGFALRRVGGDRTLRVRGRRFHFDQRIAGAYGRLLAGDWNEPETHRFLNRMVEASSQPVHFVEVGASIGAFLLDLAAHPGVAAVLAVEPDGRSAAACRKHASLNGWSHVRVVEVPVSADGRAVRFHAPPGAPQSGTIAPDPRESTEGRVEMPSTTLDQLTKVLRGPMILLVDVEGAELSVLEGGRGLLQRERPLVVFEYNHVTRRRFAIESVRALLGAGWQIWRLRRDGQLDRRYDKAWNCVAVHEDTPFFPACTPLVLT